MCATGTKPVSQSERKIHDFLWNPCNVVRMVIFTERGLPALTGIVEDLERKFGDDADFPLENPRYRQAIGRMIRLVMNYHGFDVAEAGTKKQTYLRDFAKSKFFSTSAVYEKKGMAKGKLVVGRATVDETITQPLDYETIITCPFPCPSSSVVAD